MALASANDVVVLKFGGTSVSTRARWETIGAIASARLERGERPFIVCSAVSGVSNLLEGLLAAAIAGDHEGVLAEIRAKHEVLATELEVDLDALIGKHLEKLGRFALGANLISEVSPKLQAQVMAMGELMSTTLGAAFLKQQGVALAWRDARDMLRAVREENANDNRHYLSSPCVFEPDAALLEEITQAEEPVVLTQGFIARDGRGDTVLLGRGGSDTSAAYFAAKLGAKRLEIWTDVPGMFTANPRQVAGARLLRRLTYNEAQELATMGAKVLHPRCIEPVRRHAIPLHICCTQQPELEGTVISRDVPDFGAQVKAISSKGSIPLISLETVGMWQQVGFLADVFGVFKKNGVSIDLVATSETNVTMSLDPVANALDGGTLDQLVVDLSKMAQAKRIGPCAAVSLVGHDIRAIMHKLGSALEVFEEHRIYMMSQAASDLNLTFVVQEDQADRLVRKLHALVFGDRSQDELLGPTWREIFAEDEENDEDERQLARGRWWRRRRDDLLALMAKHQEPLYVYDRATLIDSCEQLQAVTAVDRLHYAIKANPNPEILSLFAGRGVNFECVSPGELDHCLNHVEGVAADKLLCTLNFAGPHEYAKGYEVGATVTLDNLHPLEKHPEVFAGREVFLRLDPGLGKGHHKHVRTAGASSKFGLSAGDIDRAIALTREHGVKVTGLHVHIGSGVKSVETWSENALFLAKMAERFEDVRVLDLGGGLGVPERSGQDALDLVAVNESLLKFKEAHPRFELWIEPGRFFVARAGVLLARVTQLKSKGTHHYIGVETGMNSLIRPALYGAFHEIINLTKLGQPMAMTADVVGPICESGDVLGYGRRLPVTEEGDVLLIGTAGAYGRAMSSRYNLREPAREVLI